MDIHVLCPNLGSRPGDVTAVTLLYILRSICLSIWLCFHCMTFLWELQKSNSVSCHPLIFSEMLFQTDKKEQATASGQTYCLLGSAGGPRSVWLLSLAGQYLQLPPGLLAGGLCRIRSQRPSSCITGKKQKKDEEAKLETCLF